MWLYSLVKTYGLENAKERSTGEGSVKKKTGKGKKALSYSYNALRLLLGMNKLWSIINLIWKLQEPSE